MIHSPLPARGGNKQSEPLGFGSLSFEDNRVPAGESRPRGFFFGFPLLRVDDGRAVDTVPGQAGGEFWRNAVAR